MKRTVLILSIFLALVSRGLSGAEAAVPDIKLAEETWDFGNIRQGEKVSHTLEVRNVGEAELLISKVKTSCGCTVASISSKNLQPGEKSLVEITFDSRGRRGKQKKTVYIDSNDPDEPRKKFIFQGNIEVPPGPEVRFIPRRWNLVPVSEGDTPSTVITVRNSGQLELVIKEVTASMGCQAELLSPKEVPPGGEAKIKITLSPIESKETVNKYVYVISNDPTRPRRMFRIIGRIQRPTYLAYFYQRGCKECEQASKILNKLEKEYPNLVRKNFEVSRRKNRGLQEAISELTALPEEKRLIVPTLFIGDTFLVGEELSEENLRDLIQGYAYGGTICPWEEARKMRETAEEKLKERFKSFGPFAVMGAGIIDGVNPCAFATIIFFLSYLSFIGRKGKEIILVGCSFTLAVFLTYLLVGLGAFQVIQSLSLFSQVSRIFYFLIIGLAVLLGSLSLYDYYKVRKGKAREMILQLPKFLKKIIHRTIRATVKEEGKLRTYLFSAFVAGFLVSLLEFACTGQVYLPTITLMVGDPNMKARAFLFLFLYNIMFILPLVAIFLLSFYGTSSQGLVRVMENHLGKIKILTALLFWGLAFLLWWGIS